MQNRRYRREQESRDDNAAVFFNDIMPLNNVYLNGVPE
jgi:hypothetical protein